MNLHQLPISQVLHSLKTCTDGLSSPEAQRRLQQYGDNTVQGLRRDPAWLRFFRELTHFFAIIMWLAAALALYAEWWAPGEGMMKVAISLVVVIFISAIFSFWQEYRIEKSLEALCKLLPDTTRVMRDGKVQQLESRYLVPGDVILLEQGDTIPADCRVLSASALGVNNATLTGESLTLQRHSDTATCDSPLDASNILLAGTSVMAGNGSAVVYATGMRTEFGGIAHLTASRADEETPLRKEIAYVSRLIAILAIGLGFVFFIAGHWLGVPLWQDVLFAIGIIVAMVPEGLLPTLTLALVLAAQRMVKRNVLIRHLPAIETLGSTTVICTDKTGTLTQNRMSTEKLWLGGHWLTLTNNTLPTNRPDWLVVFQSFFDTAAGCHTLQQADDGQWLGDPMEVALRQMANSLSAPQATHKRVGEIPFDSQRMRLSVIYQQENVASIYCKGAPEKLLELCSHILMGEHRQVLTDQQRQSVLEAQQSMAEQGLRVLAFACKALPHDSSDDTECDLTFCGLAGLEDPVRPEVPAAIAHCHSAGIRVFMITGDHPRTAAAIARKIGLTRNEHPVIITGDQLRQMSAAELILALDATDIVFARVAPDQKMQIVQALKDKQQVVAVTGDGVNDAPALKAAHIGVAMGRSGTDVAREAADMVLLDDNFASIVNGIEEGRSVFSNIRKFLTYILAHNVPELVPYLVFVLLPVPLALTPIQILAVDMAADSVTGLGLGTEQPEPGTLQQKPRSLHERLMNGWLAWRAYALLGLIEAAAAMTLFFVVLYQGGWSWGQELAYNQLLYQQATTACFGSILLMQIINVFLCRSDYHSVFVTGIRGNQVVLYGVLLEMIVFLVACYTPFGHWLVGTASLDPHIWLLLLPFAGLMLGVDELLKYLRRRVSPVTGQ